MPGPEFSLVERPAIDFLTELGYTWLSKEKAELQRNGLNQVILRDHLVDAVQRLNDVDPDLAHRVYHELLAVSDNERWLEYLRGSYSRAAAGEATHRTIRLLDFEDPANNTFTVTNQFRVESQHPRVADLVVHVNGIPLVVLEAKKPGAGKLLSAYEQIRLYEQQIPRLFHANAFNIVTDRQTLRYGTTGADWAYWGHWRDPWPRAGDDFRSEMEQGLWALLEPSRLLDLVAHFIVFEREPETGRVVKKMGRYQQHRAVQRVYERAQDAERRRGLIWHTQGSGKSLTMVFSVLKLKLHRTDPSPLLPSPNILVITDRKDLDRQIAATFHACGLPNPKPMGSMDELRRTIHSGVSGLTVLSTIHKFEGSRTPVENSGDWIVFVDEAHRTQEQDLGAYLRATFPDAWLFGFTGTPVKKDDLDTFRNFSPEGEAYLDRYSIDDAVADGATVPIRYTSRKAEWHIDPAEIDILFDNWFADEPEDVVEALKERGVTIAELAKHPRRVELIAFDLWQHFKGHAMPDGYKAQIVAIDREAVILYKRALDRLIAKELVRDEGLDEAEALERAEAMSVPVYSSNQDDAKPSDDARVNELRADLRKYALDEDGEKQAIARFHKRWEPPHFLIVCNKLLTGFDAPHESVMYLDSPLRDHNLLQAIARTNRVADDKKRFGLIVDYIGITRKLDEALDAYREEDVEHAMRDLEVERDALRQAHRELFEMVGVSRRKGRESEEYEALIEQLGSEDVWYTFRRKADAFIRAYESLSPDPEVLDYQGDLKWVVNFLAVATPEFEKNPPPDLSGMSGKIRRLLEEHLEVTGLKTVVKLRHITDPEFWDDFAGDRPARELRQATIRKATELKRITYEKVQENPLRYETFSERVLEVIRRFEEGQLAAAEALEEFEGIAKDLVDEDNAHEASGLNPRAYGVLKILESLMDEEGAEGDDEDGPAPPEGGTAKEGQGGAGGSGPDRLARLAEEIDAIYGDDARAPVEWHLKEQVRKELRQEVRYRAHQAGFEKVREVADRVEQYALRHYVKLPAA
ncbi:MAG: type I restriction endonuclease subunit R [Gemmatimonadota bacterium]|nr:type I restriction endonuclease subunit R [Gemmatimonadota bacterium]